MPGKKKSGLYANIHAKRKRIKAGSGEKMKKKGSKGSPTAANFKRAAKTAKKKQKRRRKCPWVKIPTISMTAWSSTKDSHYSSKGLSNSSTRSRLEPRRTPLCFYLNGLREPKFTHWRTCKPR